MIEASLITAAISALHRAGLLVLFNHDMHGGFCHHKSLTRGFSFNYIYLFLFTIDFGLAFHIPEFRVSACVHCGSSESPPNCSSRALIYYF